MAKRPRSLLLKFPGTNADEETARALREVGFDSETLPIARVTEASFEGIDLVVFSGGFSYGDYVMSGRLAKLEMKRRLGRTLQDYFEKGGHLLGICNGFQILTQLGLLPEASLIDNESERFICRWVGLEVKNPANPFLQQLPASFELPIAHAEGRVMTLTPEKADEYLSQGLAALCYQDEVNGSYQRIAGLQDSTGRAFGLMPHPERFLYRWQSCDPDWQGDDSWGWGYYFFKSIHDKLAGLPSTG